MRMTKGFQPWGENKKQKGKRNRFHKKKGPDLHSSAAPMNLAAESAIGSGNCYSDGMISSTRKSEIHGESFSAFTRPVLV